MSQCLRCSKLCEPTTVFCEECRSLLRTQLRQRPSLYASQQATSSSYDDPPTLAEHISVQGDPLERITSPLASNRVNELPQPQALVAQPDIVEQAVTRLSEAAHLIEQGEDLGKNDRKARLYSRASRLSPIVDISADIRRESTPLPQISSTVENNGNSPSRVDSGSAIPDYWPWFDEGTEDKENDIWADRTDPLISRHVPTGAESASIEEEDMRRALAEGISTSRFPIPSVRLHSSRLRVTFIILVIFALMALIADGILLNVAFNHSQHNNPTTNGFPTLTLSSNTASVGSTVQVTLTQFAPLTRVALTHDIQEPMPINGTSFVTTNLRGTARFSLGIDPTWGPGFHLLVAEAVSTHATASATLQITGEGPTPPPHLLLDPAPLAMGADFVGANTIRAFTLANGGGGSISWSANSNRSWLLVAPSQGVFSQHQVISLAVQRIGLTPGDYSGSITISSNVSPPEHLAVEMTVRALPPGPALAVSPALLSFSATDGEPTLTSQTLTISNPGTRPLQWALASVQGLSCPWLQVTPTTGSVLPGASESLSVNVQSHCVLPGASTGTLTFTAPGAIDSSQAVNVSLVVQPRCGLVTSTGTLAYTVVAGQNTLATQSVNMNATASCAGTPLAWTASSTASWVTVTPGSGQLQGTASTVVTVSVNAAGLGHGSHAADLSFAFGASTLSIMVQVNVQAAPPTAPILGASPLNLNFSAIQGQPGPTGQVVTLTNNGQSALTWHATAQPLASCWLCVSPQGGTIAPGQSSQVTITVNTTALTPGTYVGQITLMGLDAQGTPAPGSPQTVLVNLLVQPPCTVSPPSASALAFRAVQGATNTPAPQTVTLAATGSCVWPLNWTSRVAPTASWLTLTPASGTIGSTGQAGTLLVTADSSGLAAGTYSTNVTVAARDANNVAVAGSTHTFTVALTVQPACVLLPPTPATLAFSLPQGQVSATAQHVQVSESGTCGRPVTWKAATKRAWLLPQATGADSGGGSTLGVTATAAKLLPGTYPGTITITATDATGATSVQTVSVTLTVTGWTISGTVTACADQTCATPQPFAGATVMAVNGSTTIATTTTDASGTYSFSNMARGTYTLKVAGTLGGTHYVGTLPLALTGNALNANIQAFPG
jgi:Viral BACON domain/Carboxypeptidase regulatory-like domain